MSEMVYQWRPHTRAAIDAQTAGDEIERVRKQENGNLSPARLVEYARADTSPIHPAFEWDDSVAGEEWRKNQARYLISALVIVRPSVENNVPVRAFVSVTQNDKTAYTSIAHAMSDKDLRKQVVAAALKELEGWRQRYRGYVELAAISAKIERRIRAGA